MLFALRLELIFLLFSLPVSVDSAFSPYPGTLLQSGVPQLLIWDAAIIETMQTSVTAAVQQGPGPVGPVPELEALSSANLFKVIGLKPTRLPHICLFMFQKYFQMHVWQQPLRYFRRELNEKASNTLALSPFLPLSFSFIHTRSVVQ